VSYLHRLQYTEIHTHLPMRDEASAEGRAPPTNDFIAASRGVGQPERSRHPMRAMREIQCRFLGTAPTKICSRFDGVAKRCAITRLSRTSGPGLPNPRRLHYFPDSTLIREESDHPTWARDTWYDAASAQMDAISKSITSTKQVNRNRGLFLTRRPASSSSWQPSSTFRHLHLSQTIRPQERRNPPQPSRDIVAMATFPPQVAIAHIDDTP
jgi:hypothetical protein